MSLNFPFSQLPRLEVQESALTLPRVRPATLPAKHIPGHPLPARSSATAQIQGTVISRWSKRLLPGLTAPDPAPTVPSCRVASEIISNAPMTTPGSCWQPLRASRGVRTNPALPALPEGLQNPACALFADHLLAILLSIPSAPDTLTLCLFLRTPSPLHPLGLVAAGPSTWKALSPGLLASPPHWSGLEANDPSSEKSSWTSCLGQAPYLFLSPGSWEQDTHSGGPEMIQ